MDSTTYYSVLSGACAATASTCGKLSGLVPFYIQIRLFGLMLICNGGVWTLYVKALQTTNSSLSATILSSASNYFLSAVIGFFIFKEITTIFWWSGMVLVLFGLILIAKDQTKNYDYLVHDSKISTKKM